MGEEGGKKGEGREENGGEGKERKGGKGRDKNRGRTIAPNT